MNVLWDKIRIFSTDCKSDIEAKIDSCKEELEQKIGSIEQQL